MSMFRPVRTTKARYYEEQYRWVMRAEEARSLEAGAEGTKWSRKSAQIRRVGGISRQGRRPAFRVHNGWRGSSPKGSFGQNDVKLASVFRRIANFSHFGRTLSAFCEIPTSFVGTRPLGPELRRRPQCGPETPVLRVADSISSMWCSKVGRVLTERFLGWNQSLVGLGLRIPLANSSCSLIRTTHLHPS